MSSNRRIVLDHNGSTYSGQLAKVRRTTLGVEDHGIVTAYLHCEWDGGGIGVGGYCLDRPVKVAGKFSHREGTGYGLDHITELTRAAGVDTWEALTGATVIVLFEGDGTRSTLGMTAAGIAGVHNDRVFILKDHAEAWNSSHPEEVSA